MKLGPVFALLWRILTCGSRKQVALLGQHIPGELNVRTDELSRLGETRMVPSYRDLPSKVVEKLQEYLCKRIVIIARGWPCMLWLWDLGASGSFLRSGATVIRLTSVQF